MELGEPWKLLIGIKLWHSWEALKVWSFSISFPVAASLVSSAAPHACLKLCKIPWRRFAKVLLIGWLIALGSLVTILTVKNFFAVVLFLWTSHRLLVFSLLSKVKFWGLIFQSGPGNWASTFWKTAPVKLEKVKLLPFCHRIIWPDWTAGGGWTYSFYLFYRKRSGIVLFWTFGGFFRNNQMDFSLPISGSRWNSNRKRYSIQITAFVF